MKLFRSSLAAAIAVSVVSVAVMAALAIREIGKALEGVPFDHDEDLPPLTADEVDTFLRDHFDLALTDWQARFLDAHLKGRDA